MSRQFLSMGLAFASALTVAGAAIQLNQRLGTGKVQGKTILDEKNGLTRGNPLSDKLNLGIFQGKFDQLLMTDVDPAKAVEFGPYEFENSAVVLVKTSTSQTGPIKIGGRTSGPVSLKVSQAFGILSTGQTTSGQPHGSEIRTRSLSGSGELNQIDIPLSAPVIRLGAQSTKGVRPPKLPSPMISLGTDNQIVKLKDGTLLAIRNVTSWESGSFKPAWWSKVQIQGFPQGSRVGTMVWASKDGETWFRRSFIDPLDFESGRYAVPRPAPQETACPSGCFGGWDRVEAYADPFNGDLYVNVFAAGGFEIDYATGKPKSVTNTANILFKSLDGGRTFKQILKFYAWTPVVMTTTPDGRLWLYSVDGINATQSVPRMIYTTKNDGLSVEFSKSFDVKVANVYGGGTPLYGALVYKGTNSISRASVDASTSQVRISYNVVDSKNREALAIALVSVLPSKEEPVVKGHGLIHGKGDREILASSFIDGDADGVKVSPATAALYWIEGTGTVDANGIFQNDGEMQVCARLYKGDWANSVTADVSGVTLPNANVGHYLGGGSFVEGGRIKFAPQWTDGSKIWMNVISQKISRGGR